MSGEDQAGVPNIPNIPSIPNIPNIPNSLANVQVPTFEGMNQWMYSPGCLVLYFNRSMLPSTLDPRP